MKQTDTEHIVLVNEQDEKVGLAKKLAAHETGALHRAISVFITDTNNNILLQRRALGKYHSGGLWSNACCSHPRENEETDIAAHRRLKEEMGFDCELRPIFTLRYKADVGNGLTENEYDHIYLGVYDEDIEVNPEEVMEYKYAPIATIQKELDEHPERYTTWFRIAWPIFCEQLGMNSNNIKHYSRS